MFADESLYVVEDGYTSLLATIMVSAICISFKIVCANCFQDLHDLFMIFYLLLTIPWMFLSTENAKRDSQHKRYISAWTRNVPQLTVFRRIPFYGFLATIPPMMWFYYRHSVLRIPGGMSVFPSYLQN